jgi:hypothetical protein
LPDLPWPLLDRNRSRQYASGPLNHADQPAAVADRERVEVEIGHINCVAVLSASSDVTTSILASSHRGFLRLPPTLDSAAIESDLQFICQSKPATAIALAISTAARHTHPNTERQLALFEFFAGDIADGGRR